MRFVVSVLAQPRPSACSAGRPGRASQRLPGVLGRRCHAAPSAGTGVDGLAARGHAPALKSRWHQNRTRGGHADLRRRQAGAPPDSDDIVRVSPFNRQPHRLGAPPSASRPYRVLPKEALPELTRSSPVSDRDPEASVYLAGPIEVRRRVSATPQCYENSSTCPAEARRAGMA